MKKWNQSKFLIGLMILCLVAACRADKSPATLLQEALYAEETEGDLDKAITIYQQVLAESSPIQRIAAQATYQLGLCHLKKDEKEKAAEYFQQVVSNYPTQKNFSRQAGEQLEKLDIKAESGTKQIFITDSFEEGEDCPTGWEKGQKVNGVEYIWDKNNASDGSASLCLKKTAEKYFPVAQWTKKIEYDSDADKLEVSAQVKAENMTKAILDALFLDENEEWIKHEWVSYIGPKKEGLPPANHDWKKYSGEVAIPENTKTIVIGLQIYGPGIVWFDEVEAAYIKESDKMGGRRPTRASNEPCVVSTNPIALSNDVDPQLDKITVTFNTEMMDGSWSWTGGGETYPQTTGKPYYDQSKTICTLPVKLEPGKVYWVGINSPSHKNFHTPDGEPAPWYIILFATKGVDGQPTPIPDDMKTKAEAINSASAASPAQPDTSKRGQGKRTVPQVVSTVPAALSNDVDPQLDKITVTFNTKMLDGSWSWTGGGETYPQTTGKPYYDQSKTICTLPVKLEPGKVYWVGINSPSHKNFKTPTRKPAQRYVILFATKSADGQPTTIPDELKAQAEAINKLNKQLSSEKKSEIIGQWQSVDFVDTPDQFQPGTPKWKGDLSLKELTAKPDGSTSSFFTWTDGWIHYKDGKTKAEYYIKNIEGEKYLFLPWLSGDVTERGQQPKYYVLKAVSSDSPEAAVNDEKAKEIQEALTAAEAWLALVDQGDYAASWDAAAEGLQKVVDKNTLIASLETARKPMGNLISREVLSKTFTRQVPGAPDGEYVIILFKTRYEKKESAVETVTPMLDQDGKWKVSGYYIK